MQRARRYQNGDWALRGRVVRSVIFITFFTKCPAPVIFIIDRHMPVALPVKALGLAVACL
jgi:hypothetical protein